MAQPPSANHSPSGKAPIQILLGGALAVLGTLTAFSMAQIGPLKQNIADRQQRINALIVEQEGLQQQLTELEQERKGLESRLNESVAQLTQATAEHDRLRAQVGDLQTRAQLLEEENTRLQTQVKQLSAEREQMAGKLQVSEKQARSLEESVSRLRNRLAFLDRDYQQLSTMYAQLQQAQAAEGAGAPSSSFAYAAPQVQVPPAPGIQEAPFRPGAGSGGSPGAMIPSAMGTGAALTGGAAPNAPSQRREANAIDSPIRPPTIELSPIVVRRGDAERMRSLRGQVVEVNQIHGFVVIDKGLDQGVQSGMGLDILRGGALIAHAVVIRVRPKLSACEVVEARSPGLPQVGDLAIQSGS